MLVAFVVYNANLRSVTSFDTNPARYLPISILQEQNLDLDEFGFLHQYPDQWVQERKDPAEKSEESALPYYLVHVRGHYMSTYPVMPAILAAPVYAVPVFLGLIDGPISSNGFSQTEIVGTLLAKVSASAAIAISVGILFLGLIRLTSRRSALYISLIYAFATSSWAVSSQGLWQSSMSQPLLVVALYCFIRAEERRTWILWSGLALALAVACRPPVIIFAAVLFVFVIHRYRTSIGLFVLFPIVVGIPLVIYNEYYFGRLIGGYSRLTGEQFGLPRLESFLGLLVSPSRGLLIHSPVLVFCFAGLAIALYRKRDPLMTYTALATVLTLLFFSTFRSWHGDFSFSYRILVDLLPGLALLLTLVMEEVLRRRWMRNLLAILVAMSVAVQLTGAFFYPCDWYYSPVSATVETERFWDWSDPEVLRCLCSGPVEPDGLRFLRDRLGR